MLFQMLFRTFYSRIFHLELANQPRSLEGRHTIPFDGSPKGATAASSVYNRNGQVLEHSIIYHIPKELISNDKSRCRHHSSWYSSRLCNIVETTPEVESACSQPLLLSTCLVLGDGTWYLAQSRQTNSIA